MIDGRYLIKIAQHYISDKHRVSLFLSWDNGKSVKHCIKLKEDLNKIYYSIGGSFNGLEFGRGTTLTF